MYFFFAILVDGSYSKITKSIILFWFAQGGEKVDLLYSFRIMNLWLALVFHKHAKALFPSDFSVYSARIPLASLKLCISTNKNKSFSCKMCVECIKKYLWRQKDTLIPKWSCDNVYYFIRSVLVWGLLEAPSESSGGILQPDA